jgi:hypothetical protein
MAYITLSDFKARAGITVSTYDTSIAFYLDRFSQEIDRYIGTQFTLSYSTGKKLKGMPRGKIFFKISAWQTENLIVTRGDFGGPTPTTLTLDSDYILEYPSNSNNPCYGVRLLNCAVYSNQYLQVSGVKGWAASLSSDLEMMLQMATLTAVNYANGLGTSTNNGSSNAGMVESEKDLTSSITYSTPTEYVQNAAALAAGNLLAVPSISNALDYYRNYCIETVTIT